jgi:pimeloyl-ACP methyl ester carboxylesterase
MRLLQTSSCTALALIFTAVTLAQGPQPVPPTPTDVVPGSITYDDVPYPHSVRYLSFTTQGQEVRMAYMDVPPVGAPNGHVVVLLHGFNFGGFYFEATIDVLRKEGFRVVVPDQIGFGRSSKPILTYTFTDMAINTKRLLSQLNVERAAIVGHSMGGMLATRFAALYPTIAERAVIYNPIRLVDHRFDRPLPTIDERYQTRLNATYQNFRTTIAGYFSHSPAAWKPEYERYVRIVYAPSLGADWPRYAMVQALTQQMLDLDPVIHDWPSIKVPTLAIGGAEDTVGADNAAQFKTRMKDLADAIPNGNGRLVLIPGVGHVPHFEAPEKFYPPLVAFLKEGVGTRPVR